MEDQIEETPGNEEAEPERASKKPMLNLNAVEDD